MMRIGIAILVLAAGSALAQPTAPPQPNLTQLKAYLSLTDAQVQSLQAIRKQLGADTAALRQQIGEKQRTLNADLAAGGASASALGQLLLDIQSLEKQIADRQAAAQPQALAVLSEAQRAQLQTLVAAAKLQPDVREAEMLGLIAPSAITPPGGRGPGMGNRGMAAPGAGRGGPGGAGFGPMQGRPPR